MAFFGGAQALVAALSLAALAYIPAAMMSFLFYTFPATVAIVAAVTRMERLTPVRLIALSLSLTGIVVMVGAPWALEADITGVLLAFAAGVVYAIYVIAVSRSEGGTHPVTIATYVSVGAGLIFLVFGTTTGQITANPHPTALGAMAALAVFSTVLAFLGFLKGLAVLGSVRTSIISTVEPFWTALLGALVLGQQVTPAILMGGGLIAAAVVLLQLRRE
jgi:drug/metabolite transporter (DMT)-like permease